MTEEFNFKEELKNLTFGHENLNLKRKVEEKFDEFIKRLKEKIKECEKCWEYPRVVDWIDKLAGDELIS